MSNEDKEDLKEENQITEQNLNLENFENENTQNINIQNNTNKEILSINNQETQKQYSKVNVESKKIPQSSQNVSNEITGKTQNIYYEFENKKIIADNTNVNNPYQQNEIFPINQGNTNIQMKSNLYNQPSQYNTMNTMNNQDKESKKDSEGCGLFSCCAITAGATACCYFLWKNIILEFCCPCLDDDRRNNN